MYYVLGKPSLKCILIKILTAQGLCYQHQMILEHTFQLPDWSLWNKNNALVQKCIVIMCVTNAVSGINCNKMTAYKNSENVLLLNQHEHFPGLPVKNSIRD